MTTPNTQPPEQPMVLGDARNAQHVSLEEHQRRQETVRQWQDQQATHLKRQTAKMRLKAFGATAFGSLLILGFLWVQTQGGRIEPSALILPTALAIILCALTLVLSPMRSATKALRQHRKNRKIEKRRAEKHARR